ncbi:MAG TPA: Hsp70 family protein [Kofleriaceae bacterium]|nr:Hsp70 family protein [Kofleriaceae bacterium]
MSDPIVGIDLGTSSSVVAHADAAGIVQVLADDGGGKIHPSVVSFHPSGGIVVGAAAKQRRVIDPQNTVYSVKRLIGRAYHSPEVQTAKARSPFQIKEGPNGSPLIATRGGEFAVPEISAIVLDHVRNIAAARLATAIHRAVVTVPASFNDAQRSATATAGAIAGLTVVRVLNEPTAAALAYGNARNLRETIAVYDFGGGTFDITLLRLEDQVYEVLGTSGDTFLGGDDLDERLVDKMAGKFLAENRIDLRTNEVAMMRLRAVAEQTKIELSRRARAVVRIDEIAYGPRGAPLNLQIEITRDEFVKDIADLVERTFPVCTEAMALANLSLDQIADVILVGGTTKIPHVRDQVARFFGKAPRTDVNPEDAVAAGAALQATALERILSRRAPSRGATPAGLAGNGPGSAFTRRPAVAAQPGTEDTTVSGAAPLTLTGDGGPGSGAVMAPQQPMPGARDQPRVRPATEPPPRPPGDLARPDTSYSVTRGGLRDALAEVERPPLGRGAPPPTVPPRIAHAAPVPPPVPPGAGRRAAPDDVGRGLFEERTPIPFTQTQPLGRFARADADGPAVHDRTAFGVPAAPSGFEVDRGAGEPPDHTGAARPVPATGAASPPPVPRDPARSVPMVRPAPPVHSTAPLPAMRRGPEWGDPSSAAPEQASGWLDFSSGPDWLAGDRDAGARPNGAARNPARSPARTQPLAPTAPIAPPTAPTLVAMAPDLGASTARGMGAQSPATPASATSRGFQPPHSYPAPNAPAPPALPPTAVPSAPPAPAPVLLEVTPRGLGIATVGGFCEELIRRNVRIPTEARKLFTTSRDLQDTVRIVVCQGESRRIGNNTVIGDLVLHGLPPRPRGETSIEVTFSIDATGVLHVRARDAQTGAEQRATLQLVGGVTQDGVSASRDRISQLRR